MIVMDSLIGTFSRVKNIRSITDEKSEKNVKKANIALLDHILLMLAGVLLASWAILALKGTLMQI